MKIIIIDHFDSYTNNLKKLVSDNVHVEIINNVDLNLNALNFNEVDGFVLSPGPGRSDNVNDFRNSRELIEICKAMNKPLIGICLGHQGLGTTLSNQNKLINVKTIRHGHSVKIKTFESKLFKGVPDKFSVITYNSLTLSIDNLENSNLKVIATENDDFNSVMGIEYKRSPLFGLQFHPESIESEFGLEIMSNFLNICSSLSTNTVYENPKLPIQKLTKLDHKPSFNVIESEINLPKDTQLVFDNLKTKTSISNCWLDSARVLDNSCSYLSNPSISLFYSITSNEINITTLDSSKSFKLTNNSNFWDWLDEFQSVLQSLFTKNSLYGLSIGWISVLGYELSKHSLNGYKYCETKLEKSFDRINNNDTNKPDANKPDAILLFCHDVLVYEHTNEVWKRRQINKLRTISDEETNKLFNDNNNCGKYLINLIKNLNTSNEKLNIEPIEDKRKSRSNLILKFKPKVNSDDYIKAIEEARNQIKLGESYELCLTTKFYNDNQKLSDDDCYEIYKHLRISNPAPYASFISVKNININVLSSSPERFMKVDNDQMIEMKPIKGTIKRNLNDIDDDIKLMNELKYNEKERAENLMIVDLIRADLLKVCHTNSVICPKLMDIESFESVHQLVSTISGKKLENVGVIESIKACFPPGSMTGSPKLRSVKILEILENFELRRFYSGCIGYIDVKGSIDLSVVIRTLIYENESLYCGAGGAITYPSNAQNEWREVLTKVQSVIGENGIVF